VIEAATRERALAWVKAQGARAAEAVRPPPPPPDPVDPMTIARPLILAEERMHRIGDDGLVHPYRDQGGFWTVGVGHLLSRDRSLPEGTFAPITVAVAELLYQRDLERTARAVARLIAGPLTANQWAALISFTFNLGPGNLEISTLRRRVNRGDIEGAADQFPRWRFIDGRPSAGLLARRNRERELFLS